MESQIRQDALDQIVATPKYNGSNFNSAKVTPWKDAVSYLWVFRANAASFLAA